MSDTTGPTDPADQSDGQSDELTDGPEALSAEQDAAVRQALAGLPQLTMPPDVQTRLAEMIAGESAARASGVLGSAESSSMSSPMSSPIERHDDAGHAIAGSTTDLPSGAPEAPAAAVIDLDSRRHARWRTAVPALAGAAAALVVGGVLVTQTVGTSSSDVVADPNPNVSGSAVATAEPASGLARIAPPGATDEWHAAEPALMATGTNYRTTTMANQVREQLRIADVAASGQTMSAPPAATASALPTANAEDQRGSFVATEEALRACMAWIKRSDAKVLMVDLARFENAPAAVVAVDPDAPSAPSVDEAEVWVLGRGCDSSGSSDSPSASAAAGTGRGGDSSGGATGPDGAALLPPTAPVVTVTLETASN